uniref:Phosphoglycerate mutase (2,3-diphosphoglycerate-dependent) n=1 Tax=Zooxanthella nutricula TaxID=1333877 RepID=A0A6U6SKP5_9DINO
MCMPDATAQRWKLELESLAKELEAERPDGPPAKKTIYFIRHAESMSNVARDHMKKQRITGAVRLCSSGFDSPLSSRGRAQLLEVRPRAREIGEQIEAVIHSPLKRAAETALVLFGDEDDTGGYTQPQGTRWLMVSGLKEMRFQEHAQANLMRSQSILRARVRSFIKFVSRLPWERIALVGHSRFFSTMLRLMGEEVWLRNASIWRVHAAPEPKFGLHCVAKKLVATPADIDPADPAIVGDVASSSDDSHEELSAN